MDLLGEARSRMIDTLVARGITDPRVLAAMAAVPRHVFVPRSAPERAYGDHPISIGHRQTISQPYIVAFMTQVLRVESGTRVLEIGTGSGYQTAVLAAMGAEVFSIEIVEMLAEGARAALVAAGVLVDGAFGEPGRVHLTIGDGSEGWLDHGPFDRIVATAAPEEVPTALIEQLAAGGRLVLPVGNRERQDLQVVDRVGDEVVTRHALPVLFVPMTGAVRPE